MSLSVGDRVEVKFFCQQAEQIGLNVRHFQLDAVSTGTILDQDFADTLSFFVAPLYKQCITTEANYFGLQVAVYTGGVFTFTAETKVAAGPGTGPNEALPRQSTGLAKLRTAVPGRIGRGRIYVPFPSEAMNDAGGVPSATYVGQVQQLADFMVKPGVMLVSGVGPATLEIEGLLYHRGPNTFNVLVDAVARSKWATQKRRGSYGRPNADPF